jgi:hypothetical protein
MWANELESNIVFMGGRHCTIETENKPASERAMSFAPENVLPMWVNGAGVKVFVRFRRCTLETEIEPASERTLSFASENVRRCGQTELYGQGREYTEQARRTGTS